MFPCDCLLIAGDSEEKKLRAHKLILTHYSSFFKGMFESCTDGETMEGLEFIRLPDNPEDLSALLTVIYRGKGGINKTNLFGIWDLADKYGCITILRMCEDFACRSGFFFTGSLASHDLAVSADYTDQSDYKDSIFLNRFLKHAGPESNREFLEFLIILGSKCLIDSHSGNIVRPFAAMEELFANNVSDRIKVPILSLAFGLLGQYLMTGCPDEDFYISLRNVF
eukprot:Colp12_sorted_trinity150504_noHs@30753